MSRYRQMAVFQHIVETGSITKAADRLGLSKSVVSQHLKQLELDLGVTLLTRTTRKQHLTVAGDAFFQQCCLMRTIADNAWQDAQNQQQVPQGTITVTASNAVMDYLVIPALTDCFRTFPAVKFDLRSDDGKTDLIQEGIDLAIRVGESPSSNLKQRKIGQFRDVLCGHKTLSEGPIEQQAYIAHHWQHDKIHHMVTRKVNVSYEEEVVESTLSYDFIATHRTNNYHACLGLLKQSAGIGILPEFIFQQHQMDLVDLLPHYQLAQSNVYALHAYHGGMPVTVSMAIAAITDRLATLAIQER